MGNLLVNIVMLDDEASSLLRVLAMAVGGYCQPRIMEIWHSCTFPDQDSAPQD
jgi:hypothetical protein